MYVYRICARQCSKICRVNTGRARRRKFVERLTNTHIVWKRLSERQCRSRERVSDVALSVKSSHNHVTPVYYFVIRIDGFPIHRVDTRANDNFASEQSVSAPVLDCSTARPCFVSWRRGALQCRLFRAQASDPPQITEIRIYELPPIYKKLQLFSLSAGNIFLHTFCEK